MNLLLENEFRLIGKTVNIIPGQASDSVQLDKRNEADRFIEKFWSPKTDLETGIAKVFASMHRISVILHDRDNSHILCSHNKTPLKQYHICQVIIL